MGEAADRAADDSPLVAPNRPSVSAPSMSFFILSPGRDRLHLPFEESPWGGQSSENLSVRGQPRLACLPWGAGAFSGLITVAVWQSSCGSVAWAPGAFSAQAAVADAHVWRSRCDGEGLFECYLD